MIKDNINSLAFYGLKCNNDNNNAPALVRAGGVATCCRGYRMIISKSLRGYVYLIHAIGTPRYKIGKTRREPSKRFLELNSSQSPYPLRLLGFYETDDIDRQEVRLHLLARQYRVHGEWFEIPEWWIEQLEKWFSKIEATRAPIKTWRQTVISSKTTNIGAEKDLEYKDIYGKAIDIVLSYPPDRLRHLTTHLGNYISRNSFTSKGKAERISKLEIPSRAYAIKLQQFIKTARKDLKLGGVIK